MDCENIMTNTKTDKECFTACDAFRCAKKVRVKKKVKGKTVYWCKELDEECIGSLCRDFKCALNKFDSSRGVCLRTDWRPVRILLNEKRERKNKSVNSRKRPYYNYYENENEKYEKKLDPKLKNKLRFRNF